MVPLLEPWKGREGKVKAKTAKTVDCQNVAW